MLNKEEIKRLKDNIAECEDVDKCKVFNKDGTVFCSRAKDCKNTMNLIDTIEALQQENEQLQAQVARMREALRKAREAIMAAWSDGSVNAAMDKASEALTAIDKAIGGKEE